MIGEDGFYALMPRELLKGYLKDGTKLSMGARVLLCLLISYRGVEQIYASQAFLGSQIGVTRTMIGSYLKELKKGKLVNTISQGKGRTCIVKLHPSVKNTIQGVKEYYTQETIPKNE